MKKWPLRIINYLTGFLILSSIHCIVVAMALAKDRGTFVSSLVYIPVIIVLAEACKRAKYFWQYILWAMVPAGFAYFTGRSEFEGKLSLVLTLAAIAFYFYARAKKTDCMLDTPGYHFLGLYIVMYFLERQYPSKLLEHYAIVGAGICLLLCMYKINLDEMLQVFDVNEKLERFPEKRLLKNNLFMMAIQTVIVIIGMITALFAGIDGAIDKAGALFGKLIQWILKLMEAWAPKGASEDYGGEKEPLVFEVGEQSAFMEFLMKVLDVLSVILVAALILYVIYRILRKIYQLYLDFDLHSVENGDEIETIYTVQTKEEKRQIKMKKTESLFWDRSPNARIRKFYKKRVLKDWKEIPGKYMTPEEIETGIQMTEEEKKVFHTYYEKARYGSVPCTKEEMDTYLKIRS